LTCYGPSALYGWPKYLYRDPKTTESTDQHSWTLHIKNKNEIWSGQIEHLTLGMEIRELEGFKTRQDIIEWMHGIDTYKYFGVLQPRQIQHIIIKKQLTTAQTSRLQTILKTHLKSKNLTKAINVCVIPSSTYSFSITS
jgi:hypothetical protein